MTRPEYEFDVSVTALRPTQDGAIALEHVFTTRGASAREVQGRVAQRADQLGCTRVEITVVQRGDQPVED